MNWRASWRSRRKRSSTSWQDTASPKRRRTRAPFPWTSRKKFASTCKVWRTPKPKRKPGPKRKKRPKTRPQKRQECGPRLYPRSRLPNLRLRLRQPHLPPQLQLPQPSLQRLLLLMRFQLRRRPPQLPLSRRHLRALRQQLRQRNPRRQRHRLRLPLHQLRFVR